MDQVISVNFSPSPILQFEPFEPGTHSELESSLLDDHQKIEIKKISDEQIPNDRSGNWTIKDFFIGIVIEAIAQTFARFASQFLTIPWKFRINIDLSNTQKSLDIIRIKFRFDYVLKYVHNKHNSTALLWQFEFLQTSKKGIVCTHETNNLSKSQNWVH